MKKLMNKNIPFLFVFAFWGLFYIGNTYPGTGETIAIMAIVYLLLLVLLYVKTYILNTIIKNK